MTKEEMFILYPNLNYFDVPESVLNDPPHALVLVLAHYREDEKNSNYRRIATITINTAKLETVGYYSYETETKYFYRSRMKNCSYAEFAEAIAKKMIKEYEIGDHLHFKTVNRSCILRP